VPGLLLCCVPNICGEVRHRNCPLLIQTAAHKPEVDKQVAHVQEHEISMNRSEYRLSDGGAFVAKEYQIQSLFRSQCSATLGRPSGACRHSHIAAQAAASLMSDSKDWCCRCSATVRKSDP
jgi:hypothetical protein